MNQMNLMTRAIINAFPDESDLILSSDSPDVAAVMVVMRRLPDDLQQRISEEIDRLMMDEVGNNAEPERFKW